MPRPVKHAATGLYKTHKTVECKTCKLPFNTRGIWKHEQACALRSALTESVESTEEAYADIDWQSDEKSLHVAGVDRLPMALYDDDAGPSASDVADCTEAPLPASSDEGPTINTSDGIRLDDIKTEYHPHSQLPTKIEHFEDYGHDKDNIKPAFVDLNPLSDFGSRVEFDFAELALEACLNRTQTDQLLDIIDKIRNGAPFGFRKYEDVEKAWDTASDSRTGFEKASFMDVFRGKEYTFDVYFRDPWKWALELIGDPNIAPYLNWDAQRLFKHDGQDWCRYVHEPWTGDLWWEQQSTIPSAGKPVCFAIYADKTRLSSMGHAQGYPVMGRLLNADIDVRNGSGLGGGVILGWLPIVPEDEEHKNKPGFVNFKRGVWHKAVRKILEPMLPFCKTGYGFKCGDNILRWLFPLILLLTADYEEQCVMALIRGLRGLAPCPVCLIPQELQHDLTISHPHREMDPGIAIVMDPTLTKTAKDELLKEIGLRNVPNVFWDVPRLDISKALCFDRLHANHIGLFKDHLWTQFQLSVDDMPEHRKANSAIDLQVSKLPHWRDFNHFSKIMSVEFSDGTKFEDIAKSLIFASHHVITEETNPIGYLLLRATRAYLEHDMYLAMEVQTEETIALGRAALARFAALIPLLRERLPEKDWNFIKLHFQFHSYEDIWAKGATRNYNTKPYEKLHWPLKKTYQLRTNFKNVAEQILRIDHYFLTACGIRSKLDVLDEHAKAGNEKEHKVSSTTLTFERIHLGSPRSPISFEALEDERCDDIAFHRFRLRFSEYSNRILPPANSVWRRFQPEMKISPFQFLRIDYESLINWRLQTDFLRCNEKFHGKPRFDGVLVKMDESGNSMFGKLLFVFACKIDEDVHPFALILPLDAPTGRQSRKDKHLGLYRLRARHRRDACFIPIRSIIRGALIADDPACDGDCFVIDVIDTDWFLRCLRIFSS